MKQKTKGHLFILFSVIIYGLFGIVVRILADSFQPFTLSFFREGLAFLIMLFFTVIGISKWKKISKNDLFLMIGMGIISCVANLSMYNTYTNLQLGMSNFLIFASSAAFSWIIGITLLKEKLSITKVLSFLLVFSGVFIMFQADWGTLNIKGFLFGILFGFSIAIFSSFTSKIKGSYGILQIYMIVTLTQSLGALILLKITNEYLPDIQFNLTWLWLLIFSVMTVAANGLYILGFQNKAEVSIAAVINPFQTIVTAITGHFFFNEGITLKTVIGGIFILIAAVIPNIPGLSGTYKNKDLPRIPK